MTLAGPAPEAMTELPHWWKVQRRMTFVRPARWIPLMKMCSKKHSSIVELFVMKAMPALATWNSKRRTVHHSTQSRKKVKSPNARVL